MQGGLFGLIIKDGVTVKISPKQEHPPYVIDYHVNICKKTMDALPPAPRFGKEINYTFSDKTRDSFLKLLQDAIAKRHWTVPIKTESQKKTEL